ncbi:hydantoinase/oxoprolinase family protein [Synergistaceae bacterium OttesenSCG-928-I11]|nr:hydantoinase/oxoprolinase family protein [Synergistaceae bacterium OttesenSCG-928-I11]
MSESAIGIDVGGTFVDVVLMRGGDVAWSSKFPSSSPDFGDRLAETLQQAVHSAKGLEINEISRVCLCSTLATNALAKGGFRPALLVLIGYPQNCIDDVLSETHNMPDLLVARAQGGHDRNGDERAPLDESALLETAKKNAERVEGIGISSFYSTRNPTHEIEAKKIFDDACAAPCVCGSELSNGLNAVRRAVSCALNASLIPIAKDMIDGVRRSMQFAGLNVPLFIVRGDGNLMDARTAELHPIQMLLSGPAASAIGAIESMKRSVHLEERDFLVLDMGGTTTDISYISNGAFHIASCGGYIEGYRTMVRTANVHTFGLGGDSLVDFSSEPFAIGPDRVAPISSLPYHTCDWRLLLDRSKGSNPVFVVPGERFASSGTNSDIFLEHLQKVGADEWESVVALTSERDYAEKTLRSHENAGRIQRCAFTPTDALILLGVYQTESVEPARKAAECIVETLDSSTIQTPLDLARRVRSLVSTALAERIFRFLMLHEGFSPAFLDGPDGRLMLDVILGGTCEMFALKPWIRRPIACLGAPTPAFAGALEELTGTTCVRFEHGAVGGAIGAALASRHAHYTVWIQYLRDAALYRAHLPNGIADFEDLETAVDATHEKMLAYLLHASDISLSIRCERIDRTAHIGPRVKGGKTLYFGTELFFSVER